MPSFTRSEVAQHNTDSDCWVIVSDKVYNVTTFLDDHPGGKRAIMMYAGKDATVSVCLTAYHLELHLVRLRCGCGCGVAWSFCGGGGGLWALLSSCVFF